MKSYSNEGLEICIYRDRVDAPYKYHFTLIRECITIIPSKKSVGLLGLVKAQARFMWQYVSS